MSRSHRYLSQSDAMLLKEEIRRRRSSWRTYSPTVEALWAKLTSGEFEVVTGLPYDAVAIGSRVRLRDVQSGEDLHYILAHNVQPYPAMDDDGETLCVFSPLGQAVLGACVGDVIRIWLEDRPRTLTVAEVQSPEGEGVAAWQSECFIG